jgi:hypothetical protein
MRALATAAVAAALVLGALVGCGDDEDDEGGGETTTTTVTQTGADTDFQPQPCPGADSPPNIVDVTSYGADCAAVEDAMAELRSVGREFRIGDFDCARTSGTRLGGTWECRGEASYFTFVFGD